MKKFIYFLLILVGFITQIFFLYSCKNGEEKVIIEPIDTFYTITFNTNGGGKISTVQVKIGEKIEKPALYVKADENYDYELINWTDGNDVWDFDKDRVYKNVTLSANWQIVGTKQFLPEK